MINAELRRDATRHVSTTNLKSICKGEKFFALTKDMKSP